MKRKLSAWAPGRTLPMQKRQALWLGMSFNLYRLRHPWSRWSQYVKNEKVKAIAARAVWLGNDETHYTRKWEDKDLEDLKNLIQLTVHWIEMEKMTASVLKEMPKRKK
ncbi:MAG: hypothetical protein ACRD4C_05105 [Candidatus Acidiferrales bacterium]